MLLSPATGIEDPALRGETIEADLLPDFVTKEQLAQAAGISVENITDISVESFDVYDLLPEGIHQTIINKKAYKLTIKENSSGEVNDKVFYVGGLFNPSQALDPTTQGLAISQVAALMNISQFPIVEDMAVPMVTKIDKVSLLKDIKTPEERDFSVIVQDRGDHNGQAFSNINVDGKVFYGDENIGAAKMSLMRLPPSLLVGFAKGRARVGDNGEFDKLIKGKTADVPDESRLKSVTLPGYANQFQVKHRFQDGDDQIGFVHAKEGVFLGHFGKSKYFDKGYPIVPIAGSIQPALRMILDDYARSNPEKDYFSILSGEGLNVMKPVLPGDVLKFKVSKLDESNYSVVVSYLKEDGSEKEAIKFDRISVGPGERLKNMWQDEAVAQAFEHQREIPEYAEHVKEMGGFIRKAARNVLTVKRNIGLDSGEPISLRVIDSGVGNAANCSRELVNALNRTVGELGIKNLDVNLTVTDIAQHVVDTAERQITEYAEKVGLADGVKLNIQKSVVQELGKVLPDSLLQDNRVDVVLSGFAWNYAGLMKIIQDLKSNMNHDGEAVVGLVNQYPPYYKIIINVLSRMEESGDYSKLGEYRTMAQIGCTLEGFNSLGKHDLCQYVAAEEGKRLFESNGFKVLAFNDDTFEGVGGVTHMRVCKSD